MTVAIKINEHKKCCSPVCIKVEKDNVLKMRKGHSGRLQIFVRVFAWEDSIMPVLDFMHGNHFLFQVRERIQWFVSRRSVIIFLKLLILPHSLRQVKVNWIRAYHCFGFVNLTGVDQIYKSIWLLIVQEIIQFIASFACLID